MNIRGIIAISVITILVAGAFPTHAFALKIIELPDQAPIDNIIILEYGKNSAKIRPLYTTHDSDYNHLDYVSTTGEFPAVADLILKVGPTIRCSGTLLDDNIHVLTAAHCVTRSDGSLFVKRGYANFEGQRIDIIPKQTSVHPDWNGGLLNGNDLAILTLVSSPNGITGRAIDTNPGDDFSCNTAVADKAGYGRTGWGQNGDVVSSGTKHNGQNCYDDTADSLIAKFGLTGHENILQYDFDNGNQANDAYGVHFGSIDTKFKNTGLGRVEVNSAPGDSGGGSFNAAGEITAVTSYGWSVTLNGVNTDIDNNVNSSFGEFSGDTRVSIYEDWISSVLSSDPPPPDEDEPNPCPPGHAKRGLCTP